jgi:hypothetical protein
MTRWVNTKEEHCSKIITIIAEYCLCQRVKPFGSAGTPFATEKDYLDAVIAHHSVMVCAMKVRQFQSHAQAYPYKVPHLP